MNVEIKSLTHREIQHCPKRSILPAHYRKDGTCRCDERDAAIAELAAAKAEFEAAFDRVQDANEWVRRT